MHFIEENTEPQWTQLYADLHTSKRMHFIEEERTAARYWSHAASLHTSKRMHFIEDCPSVRYLGMLFPLAYVKTYALH